MKLALLLATAMLLFCGSLAGKELQIEQLTANHYVFTTWRSLDGTPFPANGMYVLTKVGVLLFDTPWDTTQFQALSDSIFQRHGKQIIFCLSTHFHDDRTAGLGYYAARGAATWGWSMTRKLCVDHGNPAPDSSFLADTSFEIGGVRFETYFPGHGHAPDNILIWFPAQKVLFGGCFLKSTETNSLGNLEDADTKNWQHAARKAAHKYRTAICVVPGHMSWASRKSIKHTHRLLLRFNSKKHSRA